MTTLEALQILKSKQPPDLTLEEVIGLRAFLEGHPELALMAGGRDHVEQYLIAACACHEDALAAAANVPASSDAIDNGQRQDAVAERVVDDRNASPVDQVVVDQLVDEQIDEQIVDDEVADEQAADEPAATVPTAEAKPPQSSGIIWAVIATLLFLTGAVCGAVATRKYDRHAAQVAKAAASRETVQNTPPSGSSPALTETVSSESHSSESHSSESQWQGWHVESTAKVSREFHWDGSGSEALSATEWLTSHSKLELSQTRALAERDKWLCIDARPSATGAAAGTIEVFVQDESVARFDFGDTSPKVADSNAAGSKDEAPSSKNEPDKNPEPLYVELSKWQGQRIELSIVFTPAAAEQSVEWREVSILEDQRAPETKVVTEVAAALASDNPAVRLRAANELMQFPDPAEIDSMVQALKDPNAAVGTAIANALNKVDKPAAHATMIDAMKKHPDAAIRALAVQHFQIYRKPEAIDALVELGADADDNVRLCAVQVLIGYAEPRAYAGLAAALDDPSRQVRQAAANGLTNVQDASAEKWLLTALTEHQDATIRQIAAQRFVNLPSPQAIDGLAKALDDRDETVQVRVAQALARIAQPQAIELLAKAINDPVASVRQNAANLLANLNDARAELPLITALGEHRDISVRHVAAQRFVRLPSPQAFDALEKALKDSDETLRIHVVQALARIVEPR
ncbi:MAG TPA: HEAT repeat domain-containing protein, partial [Pirellulales bacterium]|nr:HEAT repeat domain-containing protein [Pirellulales bacterium]